MVKAIVELRDGGNVRLYASNFVMLLRKLDALHQCVGVKSFTALEGKRANRRRANATHI